METGYQSLAELIPAALPRCGDLACVLGFDGTVDVICKPVRQRHGTGGDFQPFERIRDLGRHITSADGMSALVELVEERRQVGGNGPLMAGALAASGARVDYLGALGRPELHPECRDLARRVTVHSLAQPAVTHALEFSNGKVMLTSLSSYEEINPARIEEVIGSGRLRRLVAGARLCGLLNWTCLPFLDEVFDWFVDGILPGLPPPAGGGDRLFFFDLADPSMRPAGDLRGALDRIGRFAAHGRCILGMNLNEAQWVSRALGVDPPGADRRSVACALEQIRRRMGIQVAMAHPVDFAAAATADGGWAVAGPVTPDPRITTGAGDQLNAGFCLGLLLDFPVPAALALGVVFSGFYVRRGRPPALAEVPAFLATLEPAGDSDPARP